MPQDRFGLSVDDIRATVEAVATRYLGADASRRERGQFVARLHIDDLILARACARGEAAAWEQFLLRFRERLHAAALALTRQPVRAAELADSLFAELYGMRVRDGERVSKLDSYMGLGSLEGWLVTLLAQAHVDSWRRQRREVSLDQSEHLKAVLAAPSPTHSADPGASRRAEHALGAALAAMPAEKRLLLNLYFLDGRTLGQIGVLLHVHESTVSRRLQGILLGLRRKVQRELGAGGGEAARALDFDPLSLHLDLRQCLASAGTAPALPTLMEKRP